MQNQNPEVEEIDIDAWWKILFRKYEDPSFDVFRMLAHDAARLRERYEIIDNKSNIAVSKCTVDYIEKYIKFDTIRNNETVQVDISLRKIYLKFYDEDFGDPSKYCLEIYVHKKLANPGKLQQEFSNFLASENPNLIDFITDTIWPHIDESVKKEEREAQRKIERSNRFNRQKAIPRENNSRYSFRARKDDEETDRIRQDVENRRETRSMRKM